VNGALSHGTLRGGIAPVSFALSAVGPRGAQWCATSMKPRSSSSLSAADGGVPGREATDGSGSYRTGSMTEKVQNRLSSTRIMAALLSRSWR